MVQDLRNLAEQHGIILSPVEHFHLSLSKTLKLRHHWIQPFVDSLKLYLRRFSKLVFYYSSINKIFLYDDLSCNV